MSSVISCELKDDVDEGIAGKEYDSEHDTDLRYASQPAKASAPSRPVNVRRNREQTVDRHSRDTSRSRSPARKPRKNLSIRKMMSLANTGYDVVVNSAQTTVETKTIFANGTTHETKTVSDNSTTNITPMQSF